MLIQRLKVSNLLSFGPKGIDLPLRQLNVLIGPNGSGKSNLLEALSLLQAAPKNLIAPMATGGGVHNWLRLRAAEGSEPRDAATVEAEAVSPFDAFGDTVTHTIKLIGHADIVAVVEEKIVGTRLRPSLGMPREIMHFQSKGPESEIWDATFMGQLEGPRKIEHRKLYESILSQIRDPERYGALRYLQESYEKILLYREWSFGPLVKVRSPQRADERSDRLQAQGVNLANVLGALSRKDRERVERELGELYDDMRGINVVTRAGTVELFVSEVNGREVPASRLSDGTLRYLALLTILLDPYPPPLIAIEEPELGLHPDVVAHLGKLLIEASKRTQLVVTTHSRILVDALGDDPESVVVTSKENGETCMERLEPERMKEWLEKYSLGQLWSRGAIGGNRW